MENPADRLKMVAFYVATGRIPRYYHVDGQGNDITIEQTKMDDVQTAQIGFTMSGSYFCCYLSEIDCGVAPNSNQFTIMPKNTFDYRVDIPLEVLNRLV